MSSWTAPVSVIVVNYNGAHLLPDCLSSLVCQSHQPVEIIVADNGSSDASQEVVAQFPQARWLPIGKNVGLAPANNITARSAWGEFLWFVNNDMRFAPDCIQQLLVPLREDRSVFATDALHLDWDGRNITHGGPTLHRVQWWEGSFFLIGININYVGRPYLSIDVPWGCGGALMVRRSMFQELRGFDDTFVFDYEDADLCWRAWLRGWRTVYVPGAKVFHRVSASFRADRSQASRRAYSQAKNHQRFVWKTMDRWAIVQEAGISTLKALVKLIILPRRQEAIARVLGTWRNLAELRAILRERRAIRGCMVYSNRFLLERFLAISQGRAVRVG